MQIDYFLSFFLLQVCPTVKSNVTDVSQLVYAAVGQTVLYQSIHFHGKF